MADDQSSETKPITVATDREKLLAKLKNETSRLSLSDAKAPARSVPKTIQLKRPHQHSKPELGKTADRTATTIAKPHTAVKSAGKRETTKIREAPTVAKSRMQPAENIIDSLDASISEDMKKVTSRILLEDILPDESGVDPRMTTMPVSGLRKPPSTRITPAIPKTIKLKRPSTFKTAAQTSARSPVKPPSRRMATTKEETTPIGEAPTIIKKAPVKRETSVITTADTAVKPATQRKRTSKIPEAPQQPKTIPLKRSSVATPLDVSKDQDVQEAKKSETAKISLPASADAPTITPVTQRKTIKIKRSERNIAAPPQSVAVAAPSRLFPAKEPEQEETTAVQGKGFSIIFSIAAALAVIFAACLTYILAAQVLDPGTLPMPQ